MVLSQSPQQVEDSDLRAIIRGIRIPAREKKDAHRFIQGYRIYPKI
jgi:hypothetical protein